LGLIEGALEHFPFAELVDRIRNERRAGCRRIRTKLGSEEGEGFGEGHMRNVAREGGSSFAGLEA
jgi:hypothetical protein